MPDTTKPRKRRMKATTDLGRQLMQKERQRMAKEQAELAEKQANEARAAREVKFHRPEKRTPKQQVIVNRTIVRRVAAVLASEEVVVPIHVRQSEKAHMSSAWTDFEKIDVTYAPEDDIRLLSATLRGELFHEGGHIRFTVPFLNLVEMVRAATGTFIIPTPQGVDNVRSLHRAWNCLEDQRMETAVVSDAPRKAAFFTPMVMVTHCRTLDYMAANYPLLVWRRYLPNRLVHQARTMFVTLHGDKGAGFVKRLDTIVTSYVMASDPVVMWEAVCDFHVLLQELRPLASDMTDAGHGHQINRRRELDENFEGLTIPIDPSMLPQDDDLDWDEDDIEDEDEDIDVPWTEDGFSHFLDILFTLLNGGDVFPVRYVINQQSDETSEDEGNGVGDLADEPEPPKDASQGDEGSSADAEDPAEDDGVGEDEVPHAPLQDEVDDDDVEDDEADEEGEDGNRENDDDSHGGRTGKHTDDGADNEDNNDEPFTQDDLDEMLQEAEEERNSQGDVNNDVNAYADAEDNMASELDTYMGGISSDSALVGEAEVLAQQIEDAFHAHTMDRQPAWVEQQRRGVLNVGRYMTRTPGDTEFFRAWTEDDQPGFDIAVSILLDYSTSMSHQTERLAQVGYACKIACQKLDIPCTVVLWDTDARVLWDAREAADVLPTIEASGGTDPSIALADLDNQRMDREKHLVLIMTDGQWQGGWNQGRRHLSWYKDDGRKLIGFGYGASYLAQGLIDKGCDEAFAIDDLMDIPHRLEEALLDIV